MQRIYVVFTCNNISESHWAITIHHFYFTCSTSCSSSTGLFTLCVFWCVSSIFKSDRFDVLKQWESGKPKENAREGVGQEYFHAVFVCTSVCGASSKCINECYIHASLLSRLSLLPGDQLLFMLFMRVQVKNSPKYAPLSVLNFPLSFISSRRRSQTGGHTVDCSIISPPPPFQSSCSLYSFRLENFFLQSQIK